MSRLENTKKQFSWKWTIVIILVIAVIGTYFIMKAKPPIQVNTIVSNEDKTMVVVGVGNTGFMSLKVKDVLVNNEEQPAEATIQIAQATQGFTVTEDRASAEAEGYQFAPIDQYIKVGTMEYTYDQDGLPIEGAEIYGVNIVHDETIQKVTIIYSHFGMKYEETVELN